MTGNVIFRPPTDGRGKFHVAEVVTATPICGAPVLLNLDDGLAVHRHSSGGLWSMGCLGCWNRATIHPHADSLNSLAATRDAIDLTALHGLAGALDVAGQKVRRTSRWTSVAHWLTVERELNASAVRTA